MITESYLKYNEINVGRRQMKTEKTFLSTIPSHKALILRHFYAIISFEPKVAGIWTSTQGYNETF